MSTLSCRKCKEKHDADEYEWHYLCVEGDNSPPYCGKCAASCNFCVFYSALLEAEEDTPSRCSFCCQLFCAYHLHWDGDGSGDIFDGKVICDKCPMSKITKNTT
tara:strand:+ start:397 stop:708 length:312 start_codon:yes stop_codon:yes gene_type:complete